MTKLDQLHRAYSYGALDYEQLKKELEALNRCDCERVFIITEEEDVRELRCTLCQRNFFGCTMCMREDFETKQEVFIHVAEKHGFFEADPGDGGDR